MRSSTRPPFPVFHLDLLSLRWLVSWSPFFKVSSCGTKSWDINFIAKSGTHHNEQWSMKVKKHLHNTKTNLFCLQVAFRPNDKFPVSYRVKQNGGTLIQWPHAVSCLPFRAFWLWQRSAGSEWLQEVPVSYFWRGNFLPLVWLRCLFDTFSVHFCVLMFQPTRLSCNDLTVFFFHLVMNDSLLSLLIVFQRFISPHCCSKPVQRTQIQREIQSESCFYSRCMVSSSG